MVLWCARVLWCASFGGRPCWMCAFVGGVSPCGPGCACGRGLGSGGGRWSCRVGGCRLRHSQADRVAPWASGCSDSVGRGKTQRSRPEFRRDLSLPPFWGQTRHAQEKWRASCQLCHRFGGKPDDRCSSVSRATGSPPLVAPTETVPSGSRLPNHPSSALSGSRRMGQQSLTGRMRTPQPWPICRNGITSR
jgi:hypothetical protein